MLAKQRSQFRCGLGAVADGVQQRLLRRMSRPQVEHLATGAETSPGERSARDRAREPSRLEIDELFDEQETNGTQS